MLGHIESYDPETQTGVIKSEESFFPFHIDDWLAPSSPEQGDDVKFETTDGSACQIDLVGAYLEPLKAVKYKYLAAVLALLLGWAGVHRFYLGFYRIGLTQLILTVILALTGLLGFAFLWSFCECILLFGGLIHKDAKGRPLK